LKPSLAFSALRKNACAWISLSFYEIVYTNLISLVHDPYHDPYLGSVDYDAYDSFYVYSGISILHLLCHACASTQLMASSPIDPQTVSSECSSIVLFAGYVPAMLAKYDALSSAYLF
jgi:hypothetical protein